MSDVIKMALCRCGCRRPAQCRGLYWACYQTVVRKVREGKTTWEEEEKAGRAKARGKSGRKGHIKGEVTGGTYNAVVVPGSGESVKVDGEEGKA